MAKTTKPRSKAPVQRRVPAVTRAIAILRFLAKAREPIGVVPLAREVGLIPSTCLHIVRVLSDEGLVSFNPQTKRYALGAGVLSLASAFSLRNPFVQVARQHLEELSQKHGCAFAAVEESGPDHYIVVAIGDVHAGLSVRIRIGTRFPKLVSATGRCLAAFGQVKMTRAELKAGFAKLRWDNPPKFEDWLADIDATRERGYAVDEGNYIGGVLVLAVPVFNDAGLMLGCIAAVGVREQLAGAKLAEVIASVRGVAREVNRELGHDDSIQLEQAKPATKGRRRA